MSGTKKPYTTEHLEYPAVGTGRGNARAEAATTEDTEGRV